MPPQPIDVWNSATFDVELERMLREKVELIQAHLSTDRQNFLAYDLGRERSALRPQNRHAANFIALEEAVAREMESRTIRAFHYTRMTDDELSVLRRDGIHLSTPETLRCRLDALVKARELPQAASDSLYEQSPFHSDQFRSRADKFWMASHPISIDDSGVVPLMKHWGGEVASMWSKDEVLLALLASIGQPRVIEIAVPVSATRHSFHAGRAVVATFARSHGCVAEKKGFDLYVKEPLPPSAILAVHSEGDRSFNAMGRGYPTGYVDVSVGYWKELTGEDS
jgi:hypothetical protein